MINCSKDVIVSTNGNDITARKNSDNKKHYDFTGQELCEVNVNLQTNRKDAQGKEEEMDCSITFLVNEDDIKGVVGEPIFGEITDKQEVLQLVKQNKEVFINGKGLHDAITKKEENEQAVEESELLQRKAKEDLINDSLSIDEENVNLQTNSRSDSISFSPFSAFDHGSSKDIVFEGYGTRPKNSSFSASLKQRLLSRRNSLETSTVENKTEQLIKEYYRIRAGSR